MLKNFQEIHFPEETWQLKKKAVLNKGSKLFCFTPFLHDNGLIRIDGRARIASIYDSAQHQMVLPANQYSRKMIIAYEHRRQLRAGNEGTLAALRNTFWPLAARPIIRQVIRKCIRCFRVQPRRSTQIMANLPKTRVQIAKPFFNCGIDYFGPFQSKRRYRRNATPTNAYGAIFVCFGTNAMQCELTTNLTTEAFIIGMKGFVARRGRVGRIYSNNDTNFFGANREYEAVSSKLSRGNSSWWRHREAITPNKSQFSH